MITLARLHEIEEIISLTQLCGLHMRNNGIDQWDENYPDRYSIQSDLESRTLYAFRENDRILGIVVLNENQDEEYQQIRWSTTNSNRNLVVHRLAVLPEHQGQGIAQKLMDFAENLAKEQGFDAIRSDTYSQNPRNQRFYKNRGYTNLGPVYLKYKKDHPYFCYELLLQ